MTTINFSQRGEPVIEDRAAAYQAFMQDVSAAAQTRSRRLIADEDLKLALDERELDQQIGAEKKHNFLSRLKSLAGIR